MDSTSVMFSEKNKFRYGCRSGDEKHAPVRKARPLVSRPGGAPFM